MLSSWACPTWIRRATDGVTEVTPVGVRLERGGPIVFYDAGDEEFKAGDVALVDTAAGAATGRVVVGTRQLLESALGALPRVAGKVDRSQLKGLAEHRAREGEVLAMARERVAALGVTVRLVAADVACDGSRAGLYYEAPESVDLHSLIREIALGLGAEVEMRQVDLDRGPPPPGQGRCGRESCCAGFPADVARGQPPVTGCGRLLCFLVDAPLALSHPGELPRAGEALTMPDGNVGTVVGYRALEEAVTVRDLAGAIGTLPVADLWPD